MALSKELSISTGMSAGALGLLWLGIVLIVCRLRVTILLAPLIPPA